MGHNGIEFMENLIILWSEKIEERFLWQSPEIQP